MSYDKQDEIIKSDLSSNSTFTSRETYNLETPGIMESLHQDTNYRATVFRIFLIVSYITTMIRADTVQCENGVSFDDSPPFNGLPLPQCPEIIKPTMRVYTRSDNVGRELSRNTIPSSFNGLRRTIFFVHGWTGDENTDWLHLLKEEVLKQGDYNAVVVGWEGGAQTINYPQSASDTRSVGYEIGLVASRLISSANSHKSRLYCVGHSLGSHVCGHAGMTTKFGRVTGLDPAGPLFVNRNWTVGLNPSSADLVDILHTDGKSITGYHLGMMKVLGHVDFYPNGAGRQPSCVLRKRSVVDSAIIDGNDTDINVHGFASCSHHRSVEYYLESISTPCFLTSYKCTDENNLPGSCVRTSYPVQSMGFHADIYSTRGIFYLETYGRKPFCRG